MGTRSLTIIREGRKTLTTLYRQYDGAPHGMGADILNSLRGKRASRGWSDPAVDVNGAGDLAVQLIATVKSELVYKRGEKRRRSLNVAGGLSVLAANTRPEHVDAEYVYTITCKRWDDLEDDERAPLTLKVERGGFNWDDVDYSGPRSTLYDGPLDAFDLDKADALSREIADADLAAHQATDH